jgi:hypothetical protein
MELMQWHGRPAHEQVLLNNERSDLDPSNRKDRFARLTGRRKMVAVHPRIRYNRGFSPEFLLL